MKYPGTELDWFVVGFPFAGDLVLLIEKQKTWCKGLWNGVGGGVELEDHFHGQTQVNKVSAQAMVREFREETGLNTETYEWECFCVLEEPKAMVFFFRAFVSDRWLAGAQCMTDERVDLWHHEVSGLPIMPNLTWLLPMARHHTMTFASVIEQGGQYDGVR